MQITKTIKPVRTKPDCAKTPNGKQRKGQPFGMAGNIEGRRALTELLMEFQHNVKVRNSKKMNKPPNGLRYRRGGRAKLAYIIARKLANCAANLGAIAPSGARFVSPLAH